MHFYAYDRKLKTGMYYLKMKPAAKPLQFTVDYDEENVVAENVPNARAPGEKVEPDNTPEESDDGEESEAAMMCIRDESGGCLSCSG